MRIRSVLALTLLVPVAASAQLRRPRIGSGRPEVPTLGPQPEVIARSQAIVRSRVSVETYPMLSRVNAPGFSGGRPVSSWTNFGSGTHVDFRNTEWLSTTLDMTASFLGGPATTQTIEGGFRLRPSGWDNRIRPFADMRVGFEHAADQYLSAGGDIGLGSAVINGMRYSTGFGGLVGAGLEVPITHSWSLQSEALAMRTNMRTYDYSFTSIPTSGDRFRMTTYRLTLGLRYNRARTVQMRGSSASLH